MNSSACLWRFWRDRVSFSARTHGFIAKYCELGEIYCELSEIYCDPGEIYCDPRSRFPVAFFDIMYAKLDNINMFLGTIYELLCMFMDVLAKSDQFFCTKPMDLLQNIATCGAKYIAIRAKYIAIRDRDFRVHFSI